MTQNKECTRCGETKPPECFYARRDREGVLSSACRECLKAAQRRPPAEPRACVQCGSVFTPPVRRDTRHCSLRCMREASRRRQGYQETAPSVIDGRKRCNTCGEWKSVSEYTPRKNRGGAPISDCRPCMARKSSQWQRSAAGRDTRYRRKYGVTVEWFEETLAAQNNRCAICDRELDNPHVDHCHTTGAARGILCAWCNKGLGLFRDDSEVLTRAARYLIDHGKG